MMNRLKKKLNFISLHKQNMSHTTLFWVNYVIDDLVADPHKLGNVVIAFKIYNRHLGKIETEFEIILARVPDVFE